MLVTPFEKTDAYKLGIVDKDGSALKKMKDLKTSEEKDAYTNLTKLVFSLKKLIARVPGGSSQFGSIIAAYWLIKESYKNKTTVKESDLHDILEKLGNGVCFVEEELEIEQFIKLLEDGGIANVTGAATATDKEVVKLKNKKPISGIIGTPNYMIRRNKTG
jgi:hypothetical protein